MDCVLRATGLTKRYHGNPALDNLNLELNQGRIIGLLGPNGSGKTTFIKMAAGLLTPTAGELTICGEKIGPASKAMVSYLPDRTCFSKQRKVTELLDFFGDFYQDAYPVQGHPGEGAAGAHHVPQSTALSAG